MQATLVLASKLQSSLVEHKKNYKTIILWLYEAVMNLIYLRQATQQIIVP